MKKIVMTPNPYRDKGFRYAKEARQILEASGIETKICLAFEVDKTFQLPEGIAYGCLEQELQNADALICFGGDGTLLHSSKAAAEAGVPILGVNIGTVGFMAELESSELPLLSRLATGDYQLEPRMMLSVKLIHEGVTILDDIALNDAVVTKGAVARVIQVSVKCDEVEAMNFSGDGAIFCTPTGSTAYSMSAGGPIVEPSADNIIITPICAHDIQPKSIIVSHGRHIEVTVGRINRRNAFISVDGGKAYRMFTGDKIYIERSQKQTTLIKLKDKSFFEIMRNKLNR